MKAIQKKKKGLITRFDVSRDCAAQPELRDIICPPPPKLHLDSSALFSTLFDSRKKRGHPMKTGAGCQGLGIKEFLNLLSERMEDLFSFLAIFLLGAFGGGRMERGAVQV